MTTPRRSVSPTVAFLAVLLVWPAEATAELDLSLGIVEQTVPGFDARSGDGALDVHLDHPTPGRDDGGTVPRSSSGGKNPGTSEGPPGTSSDLPAITSEDRWNFWSPLPPVINNPLMRLSVITPSVMVISTWGLSIMSTPPLGGPPALSKTSPALPALITSNRLNPGDVQSFVISPDDDDEVVEDGIKMAYTRPLNRVIGTSVLFLIFGLLFLKGRRDVGSH